MKRERERESKLPDVSLPIRVLISFRNKDPILITSCKPNYLTKASSPNTSHWSLGLQHMNFAGHNSVQSMNIC